MDSLPSELRLSPRLRTPTSRQHPVLYTWPRRRPSPVLPPRATAGTLPHTAAGPPLLPGPVAHGRCSAAPRFSLFSFLEGLACLSALQTAGEDRRASDQWAGRHHRQAGSTGRAAKRVWRVPRRRRQTSTDPVAAASVLDRDNQANGPSSTMPRGLRTSARRKSARANPRYRQLAVHSPLLQARLCLVSTTRPLLPLGPPPRGQAAPRRAARRRPPPPAAALSPSSSSPPHPRHPCATVVMTQNRGGDLLQVLRVAGVPEHFNIPWHLAIESKSFENAGVKVKAPAKAAEAAWAQVAGAHARAAATLPTRSSSGHAYTCVCVRACGVCPD